MIAAGTISLDRHNMLIRQEITRWRGREVGTQGDGFLALFDGPARAVRCAQSVVKSMRSLGLEVRCGLHCGEVETMGDNVGGIAVHIGARVAALPQANEVLVSSTIKTWWPARGCPSPRGANASCVASQGSGGCFAPTRDCRGTGSAA